MINFYAIKKIHFRLIITGISLLLPFLFSFSSTNNKPYGTVRIKFIHSANGKNLTLRDSSYTNNNGDSYFITKLKYYIGFISLSENLQQLETLPYYLVNAANEVNEIDIPAKPGSLKSISFLLGVDSIYNCSGAQSGALDPMNDMFWTWNSGYIFFKLEGTSSASAADLNRIEHHIGGYKAGNNAAQKIQLIFPENKPCLINENKVTEILVELNLDQYWNGKEKIIISQLPLCMIPGAEALKIAGNFPGLFSIKSIRELP